jgi:hypothetical protein
MTEPTAFHLAPAGPGEYPQGTLAVSLLSERTGDGRRQWAAAIAWREHANQTPRIIFDAVVPGARRWDLHDTDPGDGALYALLYTVHTGVPWQPPGWPEYVSNVITRGIYAIAV